MTRQRKNQTGAAGALLLLAGILIVLLVGALAFDLAHLATVQAELQNASDAAALAGAHDLPDKFYDARENALRVARQNTADGKAVSNESADTTVTVDVTPPAGGNSGMVLVTSTMEVKHILACLFGRDKDKVTARAQTGISRGIRRLCSNQAFPLAVSIDAHFPGGKPLYECRIGDTFELYINSQQVKNAAFTSFTESTANANYINSAISQRLGLEPQIPWFIPAIDVGDNINLNNGIVGQKHLSQQPYLQALTSQKALVLPVIAGDPPFNQSRPVIGFISVRPTAVTVNEAGGVVETITCTLVKTSVRGRSGAPAGTGSAEVDACLTSTSVGTVRLL